MQIHMTGHKLEVTDSLRSFTTEKFDKLHRHFHDITSINITFDVEKLNQIAKATIHVANKELHASAESEDMYAAIDMLIDTLDRQLIKHKEKIQDHRE